MSAPQIELTSGASVEYRFLADESHPHRVRFWLLTLDTEQLTLQTAHEPEPKLLEITWHDLYDLLEVRPALLDEVEELRTEVLQLQNECTHLRTHWHRLKRIVNARQVDVGDARVIDLSRRLAERST